MTDSTVHPFAADGYPEGAIVELAAASAGSQEIVLRGDCLTALTPEQRRIAGERVMRAYLHTLTHPLWCNDDEHVLEETYCQSEHVDLGLFGYSWAQLVGGGCAEQGTTEVQLTIGTAGHELTLTVNEVRSMGAALVELANRAERRC